MVGLGGSSAPDVSRVGVAAGDESRGGGGGGVPNTSSNGSSGNVWALAALCLVCLSLRPPATTGGNASTLGDNIGMVGVVLASVGGSCCSIGDNTGIVGVVKEFISSDSSCCSMGVGVCSVDCGNASWLCSSSSELVAHWYIFPGKRGTYDVAIHVRCPSNARTPTHSACRWRTQTL